MPLTMPFSPSGPWVPILSATNPAMPFSLSSGSLLHLDSFSLLSTLSYDPPDKPFQISPSSGCALDQEPKMTPYQSWMKSNLLSLGLPRLSLSGLVLLNKLCFPFLHSLHFLIHLPSILNVNASTSLRFCPWFSSYPPSLLHRVPSVPLLCSSANFLS